MELSSDSDENSDGERTIRGRSGSEETQLLQDAGRRHDDKRHIPGTWEFGVYHGLPGFDPENPDEWPGRPQDFEAPVRIDQNVLNLMAAPHLDILNEGFNYEDDEDDEDDVFQEPLAIMVDGVPLELPMLPNHDDLVEMPNVEEANIAYDDEMEFERPPSPLRIPLADRFGGNDDFGLEPLDMPDDFWDDFDQEPPNMDSDDDDEEDDEVEIFDEDNANIEDENITAEPISDKQGRVIGRRQRVSRTYSLPGDHGSTMHIESEVTIDRRQLSPIERQSESPTRARLDTY